MNFQADLPLLLVLLALLAFSIFIAAAEASFLRVPAVRVRAMAESGSRRARQLQEMTSRMPNVLNAILLAALLSQIAAATVAGILAIRWFDERIGPTIASVGLTVIMYIYAEAIPKTYAVRNAARVALLTAIPLAVVERILRPIVSVLVWIADLQMPGKGMEGSPTVTEDELRMLASAAASEGEITDEDAALIDRAFRIGDREADDVMVPRTDIVAVVTTMTVDEAVEIAIESGHRRLPVYEDSRENMTGVVGLRDMIAVPVERRSHVQVGALAEDLLVVPQSKRLLDLLQEMQQSTTHLAIVVDEYGGTAGLVTVEDIVEEVLGSISVTPTSEGISQVNDDTWVIDGTLPVEDLGELMHRNLEDDDWNTAAGLVMAELGRLPRLGDHVTYEGHTLKVIGLRGRRVTRIEVRRT
jgi:CBS domain containing-hemolysin-like protein